MKGTGLAAVVWLGVAVVVAGAALPASRPSAKGRVDRDMNVVANEAHHFRVAVPKNWKEAGNSGDGLSYDLPRDPRDLRMGGSWHVMAGRMCHEGATLEEEVEANKKLWAEQYKGYKLVREEKTQLDGVPAWVVVYDRTYDGVEQPSPRSPQLKQVERKMRSMSVVCVNRGEAYFSDFNVDSGGFDSKVGLVKRILGTFEWTGEK